MEIPVFEAVVFLVIGAAMGWALRRFGKWTMGWAVAAALAVALLAGFSTATGAWAKPFHGATSILLSAIFGVFFFAAMRHQGRPLRRAVLAAILSFAAGVVLTYPVETHAVKLDMPRP